MFLEHGFATLPTFSNIRRAGSREFTRPITTGCLLWSAVRVWMNPELDVRSSQRGHGPGAAAWHLESPGWR